MRLGKDYGPLPVRVLGDLDAAAHLQECLLESTPHRCPKMRTRVGFVAELVAFIKGEEGPMPRNQANEGMIRKKLFKAMKDHGMHGHHITEQIELAVNAVFLLSHSEKVALALSASEGFEEDKRLRNHGFVAKSAGKALYSRKPTPLK